VVRVTTGCMWSGKSAALLAVVRYYLSSPQPIRVEAYVPSTAGVAVIRSRDGSPSLPAKPVEDKDFHDLSFREDHLKYLVVVSECQFLGPGLASFTARHMRSHDVCLLLEGLSYDSDHQPFGPLLEITSWGCPTTTLYACCAVCRGRATHTYHRGPKGAQVQVGDSGYEPRCEPCWLMGRQWA